MAGESIVNENRLGITGDEAAEYIGVTKRTMERWRVTGDGPRFVKVGRHCLYRRADLDAWVDARVFENTAAAKASRKVGV
jgi:excisionase family DNA binding protein